MDKILCCFNFCEVWELFCVNTSHEKQYHNIGIKHDFPFINIRKVLREMLKTKVLNTSRGTLRMLMNDKIMFERYYA